MHLSFRLHARTLIVALAAATAVGLDTPRAGAEALLLVEVESGKVLFAEHATSPWYPASVTKIMTAYTTLRAVKEGRVKLDTPLTVSPNAYAQQPTKMGFPVGTQVTIDNALKMLMVKSANDMAVVLAEGVGGSIEGFSDQMNANARRLGMTQSSFVNPNGLPADDQITSARDLAILTRTVLREFPEYDHYWHIPAIQFGKRVIRNYNSLIGRYPGADGMKTGFICASGFNLVATATRNGKRLIAVVLGAPSSQLRALKAAQLLERGFNAGPLAWLAPSAGSVEGLTPVNTAPPNLREDMCGAHRKRQATEDEDEFLSNSSADSPYAVFLSALRVPNSKAASLLTDVPVGKPVVVFTGKSPGGPQAVIAEPKAPKAAKAGSKSATKPGQVAAKSAAGSKSEQGKTQAKAKAKTETPAKPAASSKSQATTKSQPAPKPQTPAKPAAKAATRPEAATQSSK